MRGDLRSAADAGGCRGARCRSSAATCSGLRLQRRRDPPGGGRVAQPDDRGRGDGAVECVRGEQQPAPAPLHHRSARPDTCLLSLWPSAQQPWSEIVDEVRMPRRPAGTRCTWRTTSWATAAASEHRRCPTWRRTAALAALAALTERCAHRPARAGQHYRHPAVVANWAVTLDHVSAGRAIPGVGRRVAGHEHEQYGIELPRPGERAERLDEACRVLRSLLHDPPATGRGPPLHRARCAVRAAAAAGPAAAADRRQG